MRQQGYEYEVDQIGLAQRVRADGGAIESGGWAGFEGSEIIELNRRIMHQQIIEREPALFNETSLDEFLVVAPGGRIENKAEAMDGARR